MYVHFQARAGFPVEDDPIVIIVDVWVKKKVNAIFIPT